MHATDLGGGADDVIAAARSSGHAAERRVVPQPGARPADGSRQERSEHGARSANQCDVAAAAIPELLAAPCAQPGTDDGRADAPRDQVPLVHAPILAFAGVTAGRGPHNLGW